MSRRSADHYVRQVQIDAMGQVIGSTFFAVYHYERSSTPVVSYPVTQQAFSYATRKGAKVLVRVMVPSTVEVVKEG